MSERGARWIAFAALVALLLPVLFLAAGLPGTTFSDGHPFDERDAGASPHLTGTASTSAVRSLDYWVAYSPVVILVVVVAVYAAIKLRGRGAVRKRSLLNVFLFGAIMIALALVARDHMLRSLTEQDAGEEKAAAQETSASTIPLTQEQADATPTATSSDARMTSILLQTFFTVVALAAAVALAVVIAGLRKKRRRAADPPRPPDLLTPVEAALTRLGQGRDAAGVVEECYRDMTAALAKALELDPRTLTPREFERAAAASGLRSVALTELTQLFELVRYGHRLDDPLAPRALRCMTQLRDQLGAAGMEA